MCNSEMLDSAERKWVWNSEKEDGPGSKSGGPLTSEMSEYEAFEITMIMIRKSAMGTSVNTANFFLLQV